MPAGGGPVPGSRTDVDEGNGEALADALLRWRVWVLRRVESVHLLHGERGRRRSSIDCVPPPDPHLAYDVEERGSATIEDVRGLVMVPLAMVAKGPMRDLDVFDGDGKTMPILSRQQDADAAFAALVHLWQKAVGPPTEPLVKALRAVVEGEAEEAAGIADRLLAEGRVDGVRLVDPTAVPEVLGLLIRDLAANFLLIALLPAKRSGTRQILKWSANWHITPGRPRLGHRLLTAAGLQTETLRIPVGGLSSTSSYHLEVHMPAELVPVRLSLPAGDDSSPSKIDATGNPVAHVYGTYPETPADQDAMLEFAVPWAGLRVEAAFATAFTEIVLVLGLALPNGMHNLIEAGGGAAGLLLAAPGALMAVRAGAQENIVASQVLDLLRKVLYGCALLLTALAASVVGKLDYPWITWLWGLGAGLCGCTFLMLVAARLLRGE